MKTCGKHKDAVVVYLGAFNRDSCPICRAMRRMEDASAKAINESEERIKKVDRANRELLKRIDCLREELALQRRTGNAEDDIARPHVDTRGLENKARALKADIASLHQEITTLYKKLREAENIDLPCQCSKCTLLRAIGSLSVLFPSVGCCQKSEKT